MRGINDRDYFKINNIKKDHSHMRGINLRNPYFMRVLFF